MQDKPFWQKSTFWVTVLGMICATVMLGMDKIDAVLWGIVFGVGNAVYVGKEGYVNRGTSNVEKT